MFEMASLRLYAGSQWERPVVHGVATLLLRLLLWRLSDLGAELIDIVILDIFIIVCYLLLIYT